MAEPLKKHIEYLKENGFTEQQASALIFFQKDFVDSHLATKEDIAIIRKDIEIIRKDIETLRVEGKRDIEMLRAEGKRDIEMLRTEGKRDIEMVKKEIEMVKKDLTIRLGSIMVGGIVVLSIITQLLN